MLKPFPDFDRYSLEDKELIEELTREFRRYSDHQFTSLWAWDLDEDIVVSVLNGNAVFRMRDYLTGQPHYSFSGRNNVAETAELLLRHTQQEGLQPTLKFIPEEIAVELADHDRFVINEDRDNYDYVVNIRESLQEDQNKRRRKYMRLFRNRYDPEIIILKLSKQENKDLLVESAQRWTESKGGNSIQIDSEIPAMKRLLGDLSDHLTVLTIFSNGKLIGFSIEEIIDSQYATGHFQRVDYNYARAYLYLNHHVNRRLDGLGIKYINVQQDIGDLDLRKKKMTKYPNAKFLKKYTIEIRPGELL